MEIDFTQKSESRLSLLLSIGSVSDLLYSEEVFCEKEKNHMRKEDIIKSIYDFAKKKVEQHEKYHNSLEIELQRNRRRIQNPPEKEIKIPEHWKVDKKHNPYYVLKHYEKIGASIFNKLIKGTYEPHLPFIRNIEKSGGGRREIYIFQIPDEAVSNYFYKRLLSKNKHRFSSFSYAYRNDRNVHYAINDIGLDIKMSLRTFVAEFDFKNFFGTIRHDYLFEQFNQNGFLISEFEKKVVGTFLKNMDGGKGIPQGTSLSLFLANIACWSLDKKLEKEGLRFARYADDTIIWADDYSKISKTYDMLHSFSLETGVEINALKSHGISILVKKGIPSEFASSKSHIEFLGYKLSNENISIKESSIRKIKKQISYILYRNLIQPINGSTLRSVTIPSNNMDSDFVTAIMQIRRYLYGNLSERMLKNYLNGSYKRLKFKGLMSFYPLIDDEEQLKHLDKWLISTILNTLKKRKKLLCKKAPFNPNQFPFNVNSEEMIRECKVIKVNGKSGLAEIPSFLRIYQAIKLNIITVGIEKTMHPESNYYEY